METGDGELAPFGEQVVARRRATRRRPPHGAHTIGGSRCDSALEVRRCLRSDDLGSLAGAARVTVVGDRRRFVLRRNPLLGMGAPARPEPRLHLTIDEIHRLVATAIGLASVALARYVNAPENASHRRDLFVAEQTLLLVRLAADTGARRGELAALRMADLEGRVLRIERSISGGELGSTKTKRTRRITVGKTAVEMLRTHMNEFPGDGVAGHDWLFSPT